MLNKIRTLKDNLVRLETVNNERIESYNHKTAELNNLFDLREDIRIEYSTAQFVSKALAQYYKNAREDNLINLGNRIGDFMTSMTGTPFEVEFLITRNGNYDYLSTSINGMTPKQLSSGERQVFSIAMVVECVSNGVLILDETINSLDPITLENMLEYLKEVSEHKQVFLIELDDNIDIPYNFIAKNNTIIRGNTVE